MPSIHPQLLPHLTISITSPFLLLPPPMGNPLFRRRSSPLDLDAVESSLRLFSLAAPSAAPAVSVQLNSEVPLPYLWEQVLNLQTGEIYYLNRADGSKTTVDPRAPPPDDESADQDESIVDDASYDGSRSSSSSGVSRRSSTSSSSCCFSSSASSTLSVASSTTASSSSTSSASPRRVQGVEILVLVGCRVCLTLSMVARAEEECPKCASAALVRF